MGVPHELFDQYEELLRLKKQIFSDFRSVFSVEKYNVVLKIFIEDKVVEICAV